MDKKVLWRTFDATMVLLASMVFFSWAREFVMSEWGLFWKIVFGSGLVVLGTAAFFRGLKKGLLAGLLAFGHRTPKARARRLRKKRQ